MATMNNTSSSSSSLSPSFSFGWTYDVFISFRGPDTRSGFTGNLYNALHEKGINTFIDDGELQKGAEITSALVKAIQESRIAIVVFSKNYAFSSFCLDELANIMECSKEKGMLVLPVFYLIDPSDVRYQKGSYGEALTKHEARFKKEKIDKWKFALKKAADLSGAHMKPDTEGYEYKFIRDIVLEVSKKINRIPLHVAYYPIGLKSHVQKIYSLLDFESNKGVGMVGIYGIEGIGKTTLARAVYNSIADQFESLCFLADIKESLIKHGLEQLQERLLYESVGEKDIKLWNVNKGIPIIKSRLSGKKVLLILDGVDKLEQLKALAGELDWFGSGSRIIITTRNKSLLRSFGVENYYKVKPLSHSESCELFSWHAFKRSPPIDQFYWNVLDRVISHCKGIPRYIETISSDLFGKIVSECNSALDDLQIPSIRDIYKDNLVSEMQKVQVGCSTTIIQVATEADMHEQVGDEVVFGLVNHELVRSFCIPSDTPLIVFKEQVAKEFRIPVTLMRLWHVGNHFYYHYVQRIPLMDEAETETVGNLTSKDPYGSGELKLFLELEIEQDFRLKPLLDKSKEDLLLFFKFYLPSQEKAAICYIGKLYVKARGTPMDIMERLNKAAGFAPNEEIELYNERTLLETTGGHIDKNSTFCASKVEDCDIIWFQKAVRVGNGDEQLFCPTVASFFEYCNN